MVDLTGLSAVRKLLEFPFQQRDKRDRFWIGTAFNFGKFVVPFLPALFLYGYLLRLLRQAISETELSLPDWDDWGRMIVDGLRLLLVGFVYLLPGMAVMVAGWVLYFLTVFVFPLVMSALMIGAGQSEGAVAGMYAAGLSLGIFVSMAAMMLSMMLALLLIVLALIPLPAAIAHFVAEDSVGAAFHFRKWWPIFWQNRMGYLAAWIVTLGLFSAMSIVTLILYYSLVLCFLIPLVIAPIGFYVMLVSTVAFGQAYRDGVEIQAGANIDAIPD